LLFATDRVRKAVPYWAEKSVQLGILQEQLVWAKEKLTAEEINKLLLATGSNGHTIIHIAAECDNLDILEEQTNRAKEKLTAEDISFNLLQTETEISSYT